MSTKDKIISITTAESAKAKKWQAVQVTVGDFFKSLAEFKEIPMTLPEFVKLKETKEGRAEQEKLKDTKGFVGASFSGDERSLTAVTGRDVITLDYDNIPSGKTQELVNSVDALNVSYCIYSTAKHCPESPRIRVVIPLSETVNRSTFEPIARKVAEAIAPFEWIDGTCFRLNQLMYYPTACLGAERIYKANTERPCLEGNAWLDKYGEEGKDWRDATSWPGTSGKCEMHKYKKTESLDKKPKIIKAFCRAYPISVAIDTFLSDVYEPAGTDTNGSARYNLIGGTCARGGCVYDDDTAFFGNDATDKTNKRRCNSFDLVRIWKYGDLDKGKESEDVTKRPSWKAMERLCAEDDNVQKAIREIIDEKKKDRAEKEIKRYKESGGSVENEDNAKDVWALLEMDENNNPKTTVNNYKVILENDESVKIGTLYAYDEFTGKTKIFGKLPHVGDCNGAWCDAADAAILMHIEGAYRIYSEQKYRVAMEALKIKYKINSLQQYLKSLPEWDCVPRLETILIDCLGAEDDEDGYTREVTKKAFIGAYMRAIEPGSKYDTMLILNGGQNIGKSTFLRQISVNPQEWYTDSIQKLENDKDTMEKIQGKWIIEVGELNAMSKADVNGVKLFMSSQCDVYRASYARTPAEHPRMCAVFGTTNDGEFLRDTTGNRRFWPVDCYMKPVPEKTEWIVNELPKIVPQLWAEAKARYEKFGETPYIKDATLAKAAARVQEEHRVRPVNEGVIIDFVNRKVPKNWKDMDIIARRDFWANNPAAVGEDDLVERDSICAQEIWCELYGKDINDMQRKDTLNINSVLCGLEGFEHHTKSIRVMSPKCLKSSIHTYGEKVKAFLRETE